jgi:Flp pilus assembly pilin Flp
MSPAILGEGETAMARWRSFIQDNGGSTAIEYCLIATFLSLMCVVGATAIGFKLNTLFLGPLAAAFP